MSQPAIITLMYHRIDETGIDPWDMCVSPENFEAQVKFLKENFNVISVDELVGRVSSCNIQQNAVCITFDDGYADNFIHAKCILEKFNCAATFFIATAFINKKSFWWDELEAIFLHSKTLPCCLHLDTGEKKNEFWIKEVELTEQQLMQHRHWKWYKEIPTERCKIFLDVWEQMRCLKPGAIEMQISIMKKWAGMEEDVTATRLPMNDHQLLQLSQHELFSIGLHTHSHIDLAAHKKLYQLEEISSCQKNLYNRYDIKANILSFPYGSFNNDTIEAAKESNIEACFTVKANTVNYGDDLMRLGRFQSPDLGMPEFKKFMYELINQ